MTSWDLSETVRQNHQGNVMKLSIALALLLATPVLASQEIVQTPAVPSDSKPNDPSVPDL